MEDYYELALNDGYFRWILGILGFKDPMNDCGYISLLSCLYSTDFKLTNPVVGHDDNRLSDGFDLRAMYSDNFTMPDKPEIFDKEVSVLEVLTAFAMRIDDDIMYDGNLHASKWFFIMISNLGMTGFTDDGYGVCWDVDEVDEILDIWMSRRYGPSGNGTIFPLKTTAFDQRKLEMWYQMQEWFNENY
jgi:hypothetical protein